MSDAARLIVCQGPPLCDYNGEKNPKYMPCPWCKIEQADKLGVWHIVRQPTNQ